MYGFTQAPQAGMPGTTSINNAMMNKPPMGIEGSSIGGPNTIPSIGGNSNTGIQPMFTGTQQGSNSPTQAVTMNTIGANAMPELPPTATKQFFA